MEGIGEDLEEGKGKAWGMIRRGLRRRMEGSQAGVVDWVGWRGPGTTGRKGGGRGWRGQEFERGKGVRET